MKEVILGIYEHYVLYKPLYSVPDPEKFVVRPLKMFFEEVEIGGKMVPRFKLVEERESPLKSTP